MIILIVGSPHSYTSAITKLLIDNGANVPDIYEDPEWNNPKWNMMYDHNESIYLQKYIRTKWLFKEVEINIYLRSLPPRAVNVLKMPVMAFFVNDIDLPIKVVYCMRNVADIVASSENKVKKGFLYYYNRNTFIYDSIISCKHPVHICMTERVLNGDTNAIRQLFDFCGIYINERSYITDGLKKVKKQNRIFLKYRISNFIVKQLSKFMR